MVVDGSHTPYEDASSGNLSGEEAGRACGDTSLPEQLGRRTESTPTQSQSAARGNGTKYFEILGTVMPEQASFLFVWRKFHMLLQTIMRPSSSMKDDLETR
jgi:hypothetical protein